MSFTRHNAAVSAILSSGTSGSTAAFSSALNNPSIIIVALAHGNLNLTGSISSITDTAGNTYVTANCKADNSANNAETEIWYALNTSTTASNVITVNFVGALTAYTIIAAVEYSFGSGNTVSLDVTNHSIGSLNPASPGSFTTTGSNDLLFSVVKSAGSNSFTPASGFTLVINGGGRDDTEEKLNVAAGAYTASFTISNDFWAVSAAAFSEVASGPVSASVPYMRGPGNTFGMGF